MSIDEAKLLYPGRPDENFKPHNGFKVGDRVRIFHKPEAGTVVMLIPKYNLVRIHLDDGYKSWQAPCSLVRILLPMKFTTPETATGGEGNKQPTI
jgi:hypothetical protein